MFMCKGDVHMLNGLRARIDTLVLFYIKLRYTLLYGRTQHYVLSAVIHSLEVQFHPKF